MHADVYVKPGCDVCRRAVQLLAANNVAYTEHVLDYGQGPDKDDARDYIVPADFAEKFPGINYLPYIVVDGVNIGSLRKLQNMLTVKYRISTCPTC
jgi:glutaredoxin